MIDTSAQLIDAKTRLCAIFGHPIGHSASPVMQTAGFKALNLNWRYVAFDVHPEHLRTALDGARAMKIIGLNLTVPHKLLALPMMDVLDETAQTWGAVNTVRFETRVDGQWIPLAQCLPEAVTEIRAHGFNTDADALIRSIREDLGLEPRGARVLLLGVGGAGRVAALRLAAEGVGELFLFNRTASKAEAIAGEIRHMFPKVKVEAGCPKDGIDLLVNATSLGLQPGDGSPLDATGFPVNRAKAVYDLIYRPAETPLLRSARAAGCRTANGIGMLLYQGARALEIWTGRPAPIETMKSALLKTIYQ